MLSEISGTRNATAFKPLPLCFSTPENLTSSGLSGILEMKENLFLSKNVF